MATFYLSLVAPNAVALAALAPDYGITWPQRIVVTTSARRDGDGWALILDTCTAEYSRQERVLAHQTDLTIANLAANVTQATHAAIVAGLTALGTPGAAVTHYSLAAVRAHESQHAVRCREALDEQARAIEALFAAITVPFTGQAAAAALAAMQALPAYAAAIDAGFLLWEAAFDIKIAADHANHGPCEVAERRVVTPLIAAIDALVRQNRWNAPPPLAAPIAGALGINAAVAQLNPIGAVAPVGPPQPIALPNGGGNVGAMLAMLQPPLPLPIPAPGPPPPLAMPQGYVRAAWPPAH